VNSAPVQSRLQRSRRAVCVSSLLALCAACAEPDAAPLEPIGTPGDIGDAERPASNRDPVVESGSDAGTDTPSQPSDPQPPDDDPNPPGNDGPEPWSPAPALRAPIALPDQQLAEQALALLGSADVGAEGSCRTCHSLGRPTLTRWSQLTQAFSADCLGDTALADTAAVDAMLDCLRQHAGKPSTPFAPAEFGVYAAAAQLPWFSFVFQHASQLSDGASALQDFVSRVGMPRAGRPWTQGEFDIVAEWFARRLPYLFDLVPEDSGDACSPGLDAALGTYLNDAALTGWRAKNQQVPLLMYGCAADQTGSACLSSLPRAAEQSYAAGWESLPGSQIRILYDNSQTLTDFWSRSSADGRYIGSGLRDSASGVDGQVVDLSRGVAIPVDFAYDPTFFPDNSGFLMQHGGYDDGPPGAPTNGGAMDEALALLCPQSVLAGAPSEITGDEPGCRLESGKFGLYQQTAKSVDGDDYWVVHGSYQSDNGGFAPTLQDPSAAFDLTSNITLTPLVNQGNGFVPGIPARLTTPRQGDPMLSPSGRLLVLRAKGREYNTSVDGFDVVAAEQSGYALYAVTKGLYEGATSANLQDLGRICLQGGKATFSYDERWLVFHHYVVAADAVDLGFSGPADPGFAPYLTQGSSNLVLVDLKTGAAQRITRMPAGQYALFPHFRSDGWLYFDVRTLDGQEWFAASDAALVSED
jgi:hypothetical protein